MEVKGRLQTHQDQLKTSWFYIVHSPGKNPDGHIRQLLRLNTSNETMLFSYIALFLLLPDVYLENVSDPNKAVVRDSTQETVSLEKLYGNECTFTVYPKMPTLLCSSVVLLVLCLRGPPVAAPSMMCIEGHPCKSWSSSLSLTASRIIGMKRHAWFFWFLNAGRKNNLHMTAEFSPQNHKSRINKRIHKPTRCFSPRAQRHWAHHFTFRSCC